MYFLCTVLAVVAVFAAADVVPFSSCPVMQGEVQPSEEQCTIKELRITPCREAPDPCRLKKGHDASISFDFVPKFIAQRLKTAVYWANGAVEPHFADLHPDGCIGTACPTQADTTATFNITLHIGKKLPTGGFLIKWKLWNEENDTQRCCFLTNIYLRR